jgi:hypothetical protein
LDDEFSQAVLAVFKASLEVLLVRLQVLDLLGARLLLGRQRLGDLLPATAIIFLANFVLETLEGRFLTVFHAFEKISSLREKFVPRQRWA